MINVDMKYRRLYLYHLLPIRKKDLAQTFRYLESINRKNL
jgi:hypothetical protein